jgi:hypothetical protein
MKCLVCQKEVSPGSTSCEYCGSNLLEETTKVENNLEATKEITIDEVKPIEDEVQDTEEETEHNDFIFCTACGKKLPYDSSFCTACGKKVRKLDSERVEANIKNNSEELKKAEMFSKISTSEHNNIRVNADEAINKNYNSIYTPKSSKGGTVFLIAVLLIMLGVAIGGMLLFTGGFGIFNNGKGKKTIMVYMIGSNLETEYGLASLDIAEMINSAYDLDNIDLLIYTGGAKEWQTPEITSDDHGVYHVTADGIEKVKSFEKARMGFSSTLSRFLNYAYSNYKAEMYGLILWDHGGGPINGYGSDEFYKFDMLTLAEIKSAIEDSPFSKEKLEFMGFDACLMSSAEVAKTISPYAKYFISSEENEPGSGWDYTFLESVKTTDDGKNIGINVANYFQDYYSKMYIDGITIAVMDLDKIDNVEIEMNNLFSKLNDNIDSDFSYISRTRSASKELGRTVDTSFDLIDLYDFADKLPNKYSAEKESLKNSISNAVIYFNTDINGAHGLSVYFPYYLKSKFERSIKTYKTFGFAEDYLKFASNFTYKLTGKRINTFSLDNVTPVMNGNGQVELTLPEDVLNNYSKITYRIFEKLPNGNYVPRFQGSDYELSGNKVITSLTKKGITATDKEGNTIYLMAFEAERGKDYVKYLVPGTIEDLVDGKITSTPVFVHLVVNSDNPNGKIEGITKTEPELEVSSKTIIDIDKVSAVIFMGTSQYKIFDESGKYMPNWTADTSAKVEMLQEDLNAVKIEFKDLDIAKEYYCIFEVQDSQGNAYSSNPVKITK